MFKLLFLSDPTQISAPTSRTHRGNSKEILEENSSVALFSKACTCLPTLYTIFGILLEYIIVVYFVFLSSLYICAGNPLYPTTNITFIFFAIQIKYKKIKKY